MSIEQSLKDLQTAIEALTKVVSAQVGDRGPSPAPKEAKAVAEPVQEKLPAQKKAPIKAAEVEAILAKEDEVDKIAYSDIQTLIKTNVQKHRASITKVLAKYGIKSATELLEEQYADFYIALKRELPADDAEIA